MSNIGALIVKIGCWGPLYSNYNKELPKTVWGLIEAPILWPLRQCSSDASTNAACWPSQVQKGCRWYAPIIGLRKHTRQHSSKQSPMGKVKNNMASEGPRNPRWVKGFWGTGLLGFRMYHPEAPHTLPLWNQVPRDLPGYSFLNLNP